MFANLKNKLIEEVKASPSKFQQFANAAQAAVSSSSSTTTPSSETTDTGTNENFFSITEEDTPQNSPYRIQKLPRGGRASTQSLNGVGGPGPRTRKLSNSSMASDISFRLPSYDAPATYHLQSDLDETSSEFDDSASTARLDIITKDQLYDAYKKSLDRYHKYRCRYTDLAKKYKELERDSSKARSVLVETQDKALRRISELREQCTLEQQAKAHLEEALRIEMDDMSCKMQAYQTKLKLLGENPDNVTAALERGQAIAADKLIDFEESTATPTPTSNGSQPVQEQSADVVALQKLLAEQEAQLQQLRLDNEQALGTIAALRKQEEENVLLLAQTKQAIHTELEHKENEVRQLQDKLKQLELELDQASSRETQSSDIKEQLKKLQAVKQEADAKLIAAEHVLSTLKTENTEKEQQLAAHQKKIESELEQKDKELKQLLEKFKQHETDLALANIKETQEKGVKKQLKQLQKDKQETEAKLIVTEQQLNTLKSEHAKMELQEKQLKSELEQSVQEVNQLQNTLKQLEIDLENSNSRHTQAQNNQEQHELIVKETEAKLNAAEQLVSSLKSNHMDKEQQVAEKLKQVESELELKINEVQELQQQLKQQATELEIANSLGTQADVVKAQLNQFINDKKEAEAKLNATKELLNTLKLENTEKEQQLTALKEQLNGKLELKDNELQQLQAKLKQQETELTDFNSRQVEYEAVKEQLKQLENAKQAADAKLQASEELVDKLSLKDKEKERELTALQQQLDTLKTDSDQSLQDLHQHNSQLNEIVQRYQQNEETLNEVQEQLQVARERLTEQEQRVLETEKSLEKERETAAALSSEKSAAEEQTFKLQRELQILSEQYASSTESESEAVVTLKSQIDSLNKQLTAAQTATQAKEKELKAGSNKLNKLKKQHEQLQSKHNEQSNSHEQLKTEVVKVEELRREKQELQERVTVILEEITTMQTHLQEVQAAQLQLEREKRKLEEHIEALELQQQDTDAQGEQTTARIVDMERENSKLAERNCLLEEQSNHLQHEQEELIKLQGKMQQVLDEHSKLQNAQEIIEHDHRRLQDKCDSYEKENLLAKDEISCLQEAKASLELQTSSLQLEFDAAQEQLSVLRERQLELEQQLQEQTQRAVELNASAQQLTELQQAKNSYESQLSSLQVDLDQAQQQVSEYRERQQELHMQLEDQTQRCSELENSAAQVSTLQSTVHNLREQLDSLKDVEQTMLDKMQASNATHASQLETLEARWSAANGDVQRLHEANDVLQREIETFKNAAQQLAAYEQLQIENEYLTKHTKQLELEAQTTHGDSSELKDKLKSLQCELYVLQEQAEQHASQLTEQFTANAAVKTEAAQLKTALDEQTLELTRQNEHARFVSEQNDAVQKELLHTQHQLQERQVELTKAQEHCLNLEEQLNKSNNEPEQKPTPLPTDAEHLRSLNQQLQSELEDLKHKSNGEQSNLQQEIDELQVSNREMTERITELETLRAGIQAQQLLASLAPKSVQDAVASDEKALLESKLKDIMNEVQDVTNRNLFLEQKCENFLILEQSNERLKLQNAKLSRQLDETLVSMQHSDSVPANTEFEYLRNIMFQYLTGNTNNETLVKVISAVLKFSPQQAQVALEKEHQRRSLLNKLI